MVWRLRGQCVYLVSNHDLGRLVTRIGQTRHGGVSLCMDIFCCFYSIATFIVFNLFIAVIVDSITADKEQDRKDHAQFNAIEHELRIVHRELSELRQLLEKKTEQSPPLP